MTTLAITFDNIRETLQFFCSVPDQAAFLTYHPDFGLIWIAVRDADDVYVTLVMEPGSFTVQDHQDIPILLSFDAPGFGQMIPLVPNNLLLICNCGPLLQNYRLVLVNPEDNSQPYWIECLAIDAAEFPSVSNFIDHLHQPNIYQIRVSNAMMRDFVEHSQEVEASIALISWGYLWMICCGAYREVYVLEGDVIPINFLNGTYRCFRLSLQNDHVVDYPFEHADWFFSWDRELPVRTLQQDNNFLIYLTVPQSSYVKPEVLPPLP